MKITGFFDIETERWDQFVAGGYWDGATYFETFDEDAFYAHLLAIEGEIWAWNGGLYDDLWFLDRLERDGIKCEVHLAGTRIIKLVVGKLTIRDAAALIPMTLQKAADIAGLKIDKDTGLECDCPRKTPIDPGCGGYCRITRDRMSPQERESLLRYLRIDCETGYAVLHSLFDHAERNAYQLTATVGGSAWKTAKSKIPDLGSAKWLSSKDYKEAREGYFGGRVYLGALKADSGHRYDINSAYPDALSRVKLPFGSYRSCDAALARECWGRSRPGIYQATVNVPDMDVPPLPWRDGENGRVCYLVGTFRGAWTEIELRYAVSLGCEILAFHGAIVWSDYEIIFDRLMNDFYDVRAKLGKKSGLGAWQKWLANSLTGKLAERPMKSRIIFNPEAAAIRACDPLGHYCRSRGCILGQCSGKCGAWTPLGYGNIWTESYYRLSDCSHVQWAAYLTAATRIKWHRAALLAISRGATVLYGDTDSLYLSLRVLDDISGDALGTWAYEGDLTDWNCLAPKNYSYWSGGKRSVRAKGLSGVEREPELWDAFEAGEVVRIERGVMGLRSALSAGNGLFRRKSLKRSRHVRETIISDRRVFPDGRTESIRLDDHRKRGDQ